MAQPGTLLRRLITLLICLIYLSDNAALAAERLHLLIPAGPGGGLDSTARAIGNALQSGEIRAPVSYENMTGGGGGRALGHFVETAERQQQTLLINSTPLIVRSLQGLFPHSYRDVVPVAGLVAEYNAFVVHADSDLMSWPQLLGQLKAEPSSVATGGGSVRGSLDHVVLAQALDATGLNPRAIRYLPYDGGGKAMLALLGGEIDVLSTGIGETLSYVASGDVRVLAITADSRVAQLPDVPTLTELGTPVVFANWRGLFAPPGTSSETSATLITEITAALQRPEWQDALQRYAWTQLDVTGADFAAYLESQEAQLKAILRKLGFIR
jgi:putative tricarboxylic transport membrane protein